MFPGKNLYDGIAQAIAQNTAGLGIATFLQVQPILAPYVPSVTLQAADLTLGTGDLAAVNTAALPAAYLDPISGQYVIFVPPPLGGWKWIYGGTPDPPISIYGYALRQVVGGNLMGVTDLLNPPVLLPGGPDTIVVLGEASFLLVVPPLT